MRKKEETRRSSTLDGVSLFSFTLATVPSSWIRSLVRLGEQKVSCVGDSPSRSGYLRRTTTVTILVSPKTQTVKGGYVAIKGGKYDSNHQRNTTEFLKNLYLYKDSHCSGTQGWLVLIGYNCKNSKKCTTYFDYRGQGKRGE